MNASRSSGGITGCTALFLIFLTLKLVGVIDWSWWWVTSPLWIPWAILLSVVAILLLFAGICASVVALYEIWRDWK